MDLDYCNMRVRPKAGKMLPNNMALNMDRGLFGPLAGTNLKMVEGSSSYVIMLFLKLLLIRTRTHNIFMSCLGTELKQTPSTVLSSHPALPTSLLFPPLPRRPFIVRGRPI